MTGHWSLLLLLFLLGPGRISLLSLPQHPCTSHLCPQDHHCRLTRPSHCLLPCPLAPTCTPSPPQHSQGREDGPLTLQAGANSGGIRRGVQPPEHIRSLVKGLSTPEIVQKPFYTRHPPPVPNLLPASRRSSLGDPMVFLSSLSHNILHHRSGSPSSLLASMFSQSPFYRVPGPGLAVPQPVTKMDLHFRTPTVRDAHAHNMEAPQLGVRSVYDTRPWVETVDILETEEKVEDDLTYDKTMDLLNQSSEDSQRRTKIPRGAVVTNTVNVDHDGSKPRDHLVKQDTTREELVKRVKEVLRARKAMRAKEVMRRKQEENKKQEVTTERQEVKREKQEVKREKQEVKREKQESKREKQGAKREKQGAKREKQEAKREKQGAKREKQGAKREKQGAKREKQGAKREKQGAKREKQGQGVKREKEMTRKPTANKRTKQNLKKKRLPKKSSEPIQFPVLHSVSRLQSLLPALKELVRLPRHTKAPPTNTNLATISPDQVEQVQYAVRARVSGADTIYLQDFN